MRENVFYQILFSHLNGVVVEGNCLSFVKICWMWVIGVIQGESTNNSSAVSVKESWKISQNLGQETS